MRILKLLSILKRMVVLAVFVCIVAGSFAVVHAAHVYDLRIPQPMASTDAAIAAIKDVAGFLSLDASYEIRNMAVDQSGLKVVAVHGNKEKRFELIFSQLTEIEKMDDSEGKFYSWVNFSSGSSVQFLQVHRAHGPKLVDAVVTLALAQNAPLPPYYNFRILAGTNFIASVLEKAKVKAGAVVHFTAPESPLTDEDIIVRAVFDGKDVPITDLYSWNAACREAVAGKAEGTIVARFIRKGMTMEKEITLINYAFAKGNAGGPGVQPLPPKGFGIQVRLLEAEELKALSLERPTAFQVLAVAKGSLAEMLQIKENDVLLAINGIDVTSPGHLVELTGKGPVMTVRVLRGGAVMSLQSSLSI
ncbi:MAG: PDZ domain-containing protein [Sporomusaceae bacterium]|nr:PDZ domain-containing protein [Sporomusaceae bacterium]